MGGAPIICVSDKCPRTPISLLLCSPVQGARSGKDVGTSAYLTFAGANAFGGKPSITTQLTRQGPPAAAGPVVVQLPQRTDVVPVEATHGAEVQEYNETLWFQAGLPHRRAFHSSEAAPHAAGGHHLGLL